MALQARLGRGSGVPDLEAQPRRRRHAELAARGAQRAHQPDQPVELGLGLLVDQRRRQLRPARADQEAAGRAVAPLPQFLRDERRERMQEMEQLGQHPAGGGAGLLEPVGSFDSSDGLASSRYQSQNSSQVK